LEERVKRAAGDVLLGIPQDNFEQSVGGWVDEGTFRGLVAQDRRRRTDLILSGRNPDEVAAQQAEIGGKVPGSKIDGKAGGSTDYADYQEQKGGEQGGGESAQTAPLGVTSGEIAALLPLSGQFAGFGNSMKRGMELAMMDSQSKGITIRYLDVGSDVEGAASIVEGELATRPPLFLVGPLLSEQAASIAKIADQANVPLLHFSRREEADVGDEVFRFGLTVSGQVERLVQSATDLGIARFAVVYPADPSGEEAKSSFEKAVLRSGAAISFAASYSRGAGAAGAGAGSNGSQANFAELARQAEENGSQAVFFPDSLKSAANFFSNFSSGTITPLGLVNWNQKNEMQRSAAIFNGAMYVAPFSVDSQRQVVKDFVQAFQAKFNQKPDLLAAQGFDAVTIALSALKQSRGKDADQLASAVRRLPVVAGITGDARVEANGEISRQYEVIRFVDGEFKGQ
jgi:ABC-type branched-subunit amino acid transport system substrate-binding protein